MLDTHNPQLECSVATFSEWEIHSSDSTDSYQPRLQWRRAYVVLGSCI